MKQKFKMNSEFKNLNTKERYICTILSSFSSIKIYVLKCLHDNIVIIK